MPSFHVELIIPFWLKLEPGSYVIGDRGAEITVTPGPLLEGTRAATIAGQQFETEATDVPEQIQRTKLRACETLIRNVNKLLRWYRVLTHQTGAAELGLPDASPFRFAPDADLDDPLWADRLAFEPRFPVAIRLTPDEISNQIREHLAVDEPPRVADLFLLDAEWAAAEGRFREAVLFCWSTIDATFNQKYDKLVEKALDGEFAASREFFTGVDFGLKNKMTAALFLVAGRSLFREADLWPDLAASYTKRNSIIHRGDLADEGDARSAIKVAKRVVEIMDSL